MLLKIVTLMLPVPSSTKRLTPDEKPFTSVTVPSTATICPALVSVLIAATGTLLFDPAARIVTSRPEWGSSCSTPL